MPRVPTLYDFRAGSWLYDRLAGVAFLHRDEHARRSVVAALALRPGECVLDIGTGTGAILPLLARRVPPGGRVVGVDISPAMLSRARRRCGGLPRVELVEADAAALPFVDASFDAVLSTFGMSAVADGRAVAAQALRVLRPGGRLAAVDARAVEWPIPVLDRAVTKLAGPVVSWHADRNFAGLLSEAGLGVDERRLGRALVLMVGRKPLHPGRTHSPGSASTG